MNLSGKFEGLRGGLAVGWVVDRDAPGTPLEVEILLDGEVIAAGPAAAFRPELSGDPKISPHAGFAFDVAARTEGRTGVVRARLSRAPHVHLPGTAWCLNHDSDLLGQFLRSDLEGSEALRPFDGGAAGRPATPDRDDLAVLSHRVFTAPVADPRSPFPKTAFYKAFEERRLEEEPDLPRGRLFQEYLFEYLPTFGPQPWPLSPEQVRFLNDPVPDGMLPFPVPRVVLWAALAAGRPWTAASPDYREELYRWYVTEFMPRRAIDPRLLPATVADFLAEPVPVHDGLPPLNRHYVKLWTMSGEGTGRGEPERISRHALLGFIVDCLLAAAGRADLPAEMARFLIPEEWLAYFQAPFVPAVPDGLTRLEMIVCRHSRTARAIDPSAPPWASRAVKAWLRAQAAAWPGWARLLSVPVAEPARGRPEIRLLGLLDSGSGLGTSLAMASRELAGAGLAHSLVDVRDARSIGVMPDGATPGRPSRTHEVVRDVELFCINADIVPSTAWRLKSRTRALKVGYLFWELEAPPAQHEATLDFLDEIWVASEFVRRAYSGRTDKPVVNVGMGIGLPSAIAPLDRRTIGVPEGAFTFLTAFDFGSGLIRKNPRAAVRAFQRAFPPGTRTDVRLVVKTTRVRANHWGDRDGAWGWIRRAAAADPRIVVLEGEWPFDTFLGLIRGCDCYVSPHRAEGFGLLPAYAMAMGKPVIVTNYGGTTDFCDATTSIPVDHTLVPVEAGQFIADVPDALWADVSVDQLAGAMRYLAENPAAGAELGRNAAQRIAARYAPARFAQAILDRLAANGAVRAVPPSAPALHGPGGG